MKNIKNFFSYALGDLFVKGMLFVSLPLLTRIMPPEQYGKLSLVNSAVLILYAFVSLNMQSSILNRYMLDKEGFGRFLSSCIIFIIPIHVVFIFSSLYIAKYISPWLGISEHDFIWVVFICVLLTYMYTYTAYLQASEQGGEFAIFNTVNKLGELILLFIMAIFISEQKYLSKIYAQIAICIPFTLYVFYKLKPMLKVQFEYKDVYEALLFGVPLIVHVLSNSLLAQADRIIIKNELGEAYAGIYSFAYNLGMAVSIIIMAWNSSWQPKLFSLIKNVECDKIRSVNKNSTIIITLISSVFILFSKEIVMLMSDEKYYDGVSIVPLVIIGNALIQVYLIYVNFVFYKKKTIFISLSTIVALAVNIFLNYVLIPRYGIEGAAWATVIAYCFLCIIHYFNALICSAKEVSRCIKKRYFILSLFFLIAAYLLTLSLNDLNSNLSLFIKFCFMFLLLIYCAIFKPYKYLVIK